MFSRILIFTHPGSRIQEQEQKRGVEKICCHTVPFFVAKNFTKLQIILFLKCRGKKSFTKNYRTFYPKKLSLSSQKYGFGIRDPGSGIRNKPIPDPGVKKAPDPGSGSATLVSISVVFWGKI
jgi:hypothetical protein